MADEPSPEGGAGDRPRTRGLLAGAAAAAAASGVLCWLLFSGAGSPAARQDADAPAPAASGCAVQELAYGLSSDPQAGQAYQQEMMFGPHPPLPEPGFYPPGRSPDRAALIHALSHGYTVVKYRPDGSLRALRRAAARAARRGQRIVAVSGGEGMPFALGALRIGRRVICQAAGPRQLAAAGFGASR